MMLRPRRVSGEAGIQLESLLSVLLSGARLKVSAELIDSAFDDPLTGETRA